MKDWGEISETYEEINKKAFNKKLENRYDGYFGLWVPLKTAGSAIISTLKNKSKKYWSIQRMLLFLHPKFKKEIYYVFICRKEERNFHKVR